MSTCGADTHVHEKLRSAKHFRAGSFERARLQPGRHDAAILGPLAPKGIGAYTRAAKRRKNTAHGASRGFQSANDRAPEGRKKGCRP